MPRSLKLSPALKEVLDKGAGFRFVTEPNPQRTVLGVRASDKERSVIDAAAILEHRSRTDFVLHYALQAAQRILNSKTTLPK